MSAVRFCKSVHTVIYHYASYNDSNCRCARLLECIQHVEQQQGSRVTTVHLGLPEVCCSLGASIRALGRPGQLLACVALHTLTTQTGPGCWSPSM